MTCLGCPNFVYCNLHYKHHRDNLNVDLEALNDKCNDFFEEIQNKSKNLQVHPLMKTIEEWENRSIVTIKQVAQDTRDRLLQYVNSYIPLVQIELDDLSTKVRQNPDDCEFTDTDIKDWTGELEKLRSLMTNTSDLTIRETPSDFINKIHFEIPSGKLSEAAENLKICQKNFHSKIFVFDDNKKTFL